MRGRALGQIGRDHLPRTALVAGADDVGLEVAALEVVDGAIHDVGIVRRRGEVGDVARVGHAIDVLDLPPRRAAVLGHLDESVIGAGVDEAFLLGRFAERDHRARERRRRVACDGVDAPQPALHLHRRARDVAREVGGDGTPGVALVVAAINALRGEVEPRVAERADEQRRIPVPARGVLARLFLGHDAHRVARAAIEAHQPAVLRLGVDGVVVGGVDAALEAIAAIGDEPVGVADAGDAARAGRSAEREVVLRAAVHVVERRVHVDVDLVELRQRQVGEEAPGLRPVEGLVETTVVAVEDVVAVIRIDPDGMVVDVLARLAEVLPRGAAVIGDAVVHVDGDHAVGVVRVDPDLAVVERARGERAAHAAPVESVVARAVDAAAVVGGLDDRVDDVGVRGRTGEPDAAFTLGHAAQLAPGLSAVDGAVQRRLRSAGDVAPHVAMPLPGARDDDVRIARIERDVVHAGPLLAGEDLGPRLTAVGGLEQSAVPALGPERALCGDVDDLGVARIDDDAPDVLGVLEAHVLPRAAGVLRLVDAVAPAHRALCVVLARAHPDHIGVLGVEHHRADGVRGLPVEDGRERGAGVVGLPHAARGGGDVPGALVGVHRDVADAARGESGADAAQPEGGEGVGGNAAGRGGVTLGAAAPALVLASCGGLRARGRGSACGATRRSALGLGGQRREREQQERQSHRGSGWGADVGRGSGQLSDGARGPAPGGTPQVRAAVGVG